MRAHLYRVFMLGLLIASPADAGMSHGYELSFTSQTYSASMPIDQVLNKFRGASPGAGRFAYTHNELRLVRFATPDWHYSLGLRYDYFLRHTQDTAEFLYRDRRDLAFVEGETFAIRLEASHLQAYSLGASRQFTLSNAVSGRIAMDFLYAKRTLEGYIDGTLSIVEDGYMADAHLDYFYTQDELLDRRPEPVDGYGLSLHFDLSWQLRPVTRILLSGRDILSGIYFHDATYSIFDATTDRVAFDDAGRIQSTPALDGVERKRDELQQLPRRFRVALDHRLARRWWIQPALWTYHHYVFPQVRFTYVSDDHRPRWHAGYDFRARSVSLGVDFDAVDIRFAFDTPQAQRAHAVSLMLSYHL